MFMIRIGKAESFSNFFMTVFIFFREEFLLLCIANKKIHLCFGDKEEDNNNS